MNLKTIRKSYKAKLLSLPYRIKLILVFSFLILLTASILGSITYYQFGGASQRNAEEYSIQLADQINRNLDRYIKEMQIISLSPLYDQEVINILKNHQISGVAAPFPPANERVKIWRYISSFVHMRNEIRGIHILANDGNIFSNLDSNTIMLQVFEQNNEWLQRIIKADGEHVILPLHHPNYYLSKDTDVFSVARLIRDPSDQTPLGIIKIDLKQELIEEMVKNTRTKSQIFIVNNQQEIIYPNSEENDISANILPEMEKIKVNNYTNIPIEGVDYMMVYNQSEYSGLNIVMLIPKSEIFSEVNHLRKVLFIVVMAGILIAFILGFILSKPLVGSIHRLREAMEGVKKGNFSQRVLVQSNDEIGDLGKGFNLMVSEIDRLVTEVYRTGLREKDAELRALQSQMNPHFLYNTLESINMLAITRGNFEVSDMVSSLGKLLRYTVDNKAKIVRLEEETAFVGSYITIQKVRIGEKLHYIEEIPDYLKDAVIPKLLLQPIIENAIVHGLRNAGGKIKIQAFKLGEQMKIIISDNGVGMDMEKLKELKQIIRAQKPSHSNEQHNGVALPNIHERIQLLYGSDFGLDIQSEEHKGFFVSVSLPLYWEEEKLDEKCISG
ncbi:sensor histidine kinase [Cytobacillus sp. FSL H8-0458]|uniref:sensor histidine kinase n=1 Tax=Cytobacillus sp. FSL H8-0458 TaxID=2975346 RepID=UPI0030F92212